MATDDFFRARLDQMIDLRHPLAVLAGRMPWAQIESALAPAFARKSRSGQVVPGNDLFGTTLEIAGAGVSAAGRPRLPIRLMAALLYLKHAFNLNGTYFSHPALGAARKWLNTKDKGRRLTKGSIG